ncbi:MAG: MarR family winged helix-turn-helix transcriptional regulator [Eubacteriales bacterium]
MELRERYNAFFVKCFNNILKKEKEMLCRIDKTLSLSEIHVIEAICNAGENNTSKNVAENLRVSPGTLTTAVNTLVHKGYVYRKRTRRQAGIPLIAHRKGLEANALHARFHAAMIDSILKSSEEKEAEVLIAALEKIQVFLGDFDFEG